MDSYESKREFQFDEEDDNNTLELIFECYFRRVYNYIRSNVKSKQDAEDLTGTVFERVVRNRKAYCPDKGSLETWIFAIAHHVLIDNSRKISRDRSISVEYIEEIAHEEEDIAKNLITQDYRQILLKALERLDERERILIALKFWSGLKNCEIAQLTCITDENVGVLVFRSMKKLKKILGEMGVNKLYE